MRTVEHVFQLHLKTPSSLIL